MAEPYILSGKLVLSELSNGAYPEVNIYFDTKVIDLQSVETIDSAGIAYLAQIKTNYSAIQFINGTEKISVLSALYGVDFLFS